MMRLSFAVTVLLASCAAESESQRLKDACDARQCPSDPPGWIDCMPIIAPEWVPVCSADCRTFLQQSCKIQFAD